MTRNYRVRLEWSDGRVTYTVKTRSLREARRMERSFRDVALVRRVVVEQAPFVEAA